MHSGRAVTPDDQGTTLVEVLVALAILSTVMASLGVFFVNSFQAVNQQRGRQAAVELANGAMEQVRALRGSSLVSGRGQLNSTRQWNAAPDAVQAYLSTMKLTWDSTITDPTSTLGDDAAIPTATQTITVQKTTFARTVYVGACDVYVGPSTACVNPSVVAPPADTSKDLQFFRVVVLVTWSSTGCAGLSCSYVASTLVARAAEPIFDFHRPSPVVTTTTVTFDKGVPNSFPLDASGGQLPNTWTVSALPAGLTMTPAGVITGTPTTVGTTTGTAVVTDTLGRTDSQVVSFIVVLPPAMTALANTQNHVGESVTQNTTVTGGAAPLFYTATNLPDDLAVNSSTGAVTGTVSTAGVYSVSITVTDAQNASATRSYTHTVYPALSVAAPADLQIALGSAVNVSAVAQGGDQRYTYSATGLPTGVLLTAATGAVSGVPTIPGRYLPTITVTDGLGGKASDSFSIIVTTTTALAFTSPSLGSADQVSTVGTTTTLPITTNGNTLGLSPVMTASGLPPGLSLAPTSGVISGKPTTAGSYVVTVVATNVLPPQSSNLTFLWTVR